MRAVVTGAAGFVGSSLVDHLLDHGWYVVALDSFTANYDRATKVGNLARASADARFQLHEVDLLESDLVAHLTDADVVFHLAGQPGVRTSWIDFDQYVQRNVSATHRVLEASRTAPQVRVVYASSSSVYGGGGAEPARESDQCSPHSPYGVTKHAGEQLCRVYAANFGVNVVALRLFTVYGPRQRPDMAVHRMIESAVAGSTFTVFGDGTQRRDLTFVGDVVDAFGRAAVADLEPGTVMNIAGGSARTVSDLVEHVGAVIGRPVSCRHASARAGDVTSTLGDSSEARRQLGWTPTTDLRTGLARQVDSHLANAPETGRSDRASVA